MSNDLISRRRFVQLSAGALAAAKFAHANPLGLPIGLQLYSVREVLPKDYLGTLKQIAAMGYQEVEAAGFYDHSADDVKTAMQTAGLKCVSSHYPLGTLKPQIDSILPFAKTVGIQYIVCSSPMHRDPSSKGELSLDDWKWTAGQFNEIATKVKAAGLSFAYHNHVAEFHPTDGTLPYDILLNNTDPAKVSFELDCGWAIVSGQDPVQILKQHSSRIVMLHIKDFVDNKPPSVELGKGSIDYKPIIAAAKGAKIRHCFVEQEEFQGPMMAALAADAKYMQSLT